jgi:hypothetical protein
VRHFERLVQGLSNAKVTQFHDVIAPEKNVRWLDVTVQYTTLFVDKIESNKQLRNPSHHLVVCKGGWCGHPLLADAESEITIGCVLHDDVQQALFKQGLVVQSHIRVSYLAQAPNFVESIFPLLLAHAAQPHPLRHHQHAITAPLDKQGNTKGSCAQLPNLLVLVHAVELLWQ